MQPLNSCISKLVKQKHVTITKRYHLSFFNTITSRSLVIYVIDAHELSVWEFVDLTKFLEYYFHHYNMLSQTGPKIYVKQCFWCYRKEIAIMSVLTMGVKNILDFDLPETVVKTVNKWFLVDYGVSLVHQLFLQYGNFLTEKILLDL